MPPRRSQRSKRLSAQALEAVEALVSSPPQRVRRQSLGLVGSASSSTHQPSILHESLAAQPGSRAATLSPVQSQPPPAAPATDQLAALTSPVTDQLVSRVTDEAIKRLQPFLSNLRSIVEQAQSPPSTSSQAPPVSLSVEQSAAIQDTVGVPAVHDGVQSVLASLSGGFPFFVIPTAGGIPVAPAAIGGNNALNTVPAQQSLEMPLLPASNSPGLQSAPQTSTLAPQLQSLNITSAPSQPSQNIVTAEASILGSSEALTTVDTTEISQLFSLTGPEGDRSDSIGEQQETEKFKSPDQEQPDVEKTDSSQVAEKESAGSITVPGDQGSSGPFTIQTSEFEPSGTLDSGFETSGKPEDNTVLDVHSATAGAAVRGDVYVKNVMLLKKEDLVQGNGKILMPTTIEMARIRKTGQYKRQVQFSKSMSEEAVRKTIQEEFPTFDFSGRFFCASISNQDSTLQFHGSPRVWDGRTIRRILKGNSALYIVMEEIQVPPRTVRDQNPLSMLCEVAVRKNPLSMLCEVAVRKERVDVKKASGSPPNRAPTEQEQGDVEMVEEDSRCGLSILSDVASKIRAAVTDKKSITMIPNRSSIKGGVEFVVIFTEALPLDLSVAFAIFQDIGTVELEKKNPHNLIGKVPACLKPGHVTVKVTSSSNVYLGETLFEYLDETRDTLRRLVRDGDMQIASTGGVLEDLENMPYHGYETGARITQAAASDVQQQQQ